MADEPFKIELAISIEQIQKELEDDLEKEGITPVTVTIGADHAGFVEFGTAGSPDGMTPARKLIPWVKSKPRFAGLPPSEQVRVAYAIKKKIDEKGTDPHPFIRPALEDLVNTDIVTRLKMGATTFDLGNSFINKMKSHLESNDSIYKWEIYDSMSVHRGGEWGSGKEVFNIDDAMKEVEAEMQKV